MSIEASADIDGTPILLPNYVGRKLMVIRGRSGMLLEEFNSGVVANQAMFGRNEDDHLAMVRAHSNVGIADYVLGVHEEVRRRLTVILDNEEIEFMEANPFVRNIWVGDYVKLYTPEVADTMEYAGRTALKWATVNGRVPEMVVKAVNGYFYPATRNDITIALTDLN